MRWDAPLQPGDGRVSHRRPWRYPSVTYPIAASGYPRSFRVSVLTTAQRVDGGRVFPRGGVGPRDARA